MRKPGSPLSSSIYEQMLTARYAMATINAYLYWIKFFIRYHQLRHPLSLGEAEVQQFLTFLACERRVAAKTQAQALNALVFLYKSVLQRPLGLSMAFQHRSKSPKLPCVLTQAEVRALLLAMPTHLRLPAQLMYGSGLRLMEVMRLRVQDLDFHYLCINIWNAKGGKHRRVTLASELLQALREQIAYVQRCFLADCQVPDYAGVHLPFALARKYPNAPLELGWHYPRPANQVMTQRTTPCVATMWTHPHCKKPCDRLRVSDNCINRSVAIRYAIPLLPICWQEVSISERCRNNWATRTCAPPKFTPMYCSRALTGCAAHSPTSRQRYRPLTHRPSLRYYHPCSVRPMPVSYHRVSRG